MKHEHTLVIVKPDGVRRGLVGAVLSRIEQKGLAIENMLMVRMDASLARRFYAEHEAKPFFPALIEFMTSGPVVALDVAGEDAIGRMRAMIGPTDPEQRLPGTIRGDYSNHVTLNVVHASATLLDSERELDLLFGADEQHQKRPLRPEEPPGGP
ncbi:MAG: nucleoside-diphosphate kinase [Caldisericota bacterium]|jgi:nucleoside-diphosphate kinase|nr:nucleoside-diphosphate kinase [Caldisericota bacterium]